jgi:hypothetical protein
MIHAMLAKQLTEREKAQARLTDKGAQESEV